VELTCSRVIIVNRGRVAAEGMLEDMRRRSHSLEDLFVNLIEAEDAGAVAGGRAH
jgi:ABC-type multidrug transport system ATPase subunit